MVKISTLALCKSTDVQKRGKATHYRLGKALRAPGG
jgi:hypothetical protein